MDENKRLFLFPVRRVLMAVSMAYLAGILITTVIIFPTILVGILSTFLFAFAAVRLARRKSVLFIALVLMLLLGNLRAGLELNTQDQPTGAGVLIEGRVTRIDKPYRVYLSDVRIDGKAADYARDVRVTLMTGEEDVQMNCPFVGQCVSGTGRLFAPDEKRNPSGIEWRMQNICKGYELSGYLLPGWSAYGNAVFSVRECFRMLAEAIKANIAALFGDQAALFQGIMLGDKSLLEDDVTTAMRLSGTAHILTVSGLHLSMIAGVAGSLVGRLSLRRKHRFALMAVFLLLFTGLTGAAAGTVRACIMTLLREYAIVRGRRYEPLTALALAALCMTLVQPLWLFHASFQFSFFVVLVMQLFSGVLSSLFMRRCGSSRMLRGVAGLFAVSLSAQIGSVPMQLLLYGYVSLLSLPMNVLCGMIIPFLLLGGWIAVLVSFLWLAAGKWLAIPLCGVSAAFEMVSMLAASSRAAILRLPSPYGVTILMLMLLFMLLSRKIRFGTRRAAAALILSCVVIVGYLIRFDPQTRYVQLDVGQGDAALFRKGRRAVLIDVGPADSYEMLWYLRKEGLFVDAVILSHLDEDHAGALDVILESEVTIPLVIMPRNAADEALSPTVSGVLDALVSRQIPVREVAKGDRIEACSMSFDVLMPQYGMSGGNERSLLLYTLAEGVSFLLTGDLPADCEPDSVPRADVLKVAHHGSGNSTSHAFAAQAAPSLAIISVGKNNRYGHPHRRVLNALKDAKILRTDRHGCITLRLRDGTCHAETYLNTP